MCHAAEVEFRVTVKALTIKAVKQRGRGGAIKAAIVKAEPYPGHVKGMRLSHPFGAVRFEDKALNDGGRSSECQEEIAALDIVAQ